MRNPALRREVPLAAYTTFGIGGPAALFADVRSAGELTVAVAWAGERGVRVSVLGRGSNVLVADGGVDHLVVRNASARRIDFLEGCRVRAESGVDVARLIALTIARGLSGLEHFAGVPSTLGGALWQNLHFLSPDRTRLVFVGDLVETATILDGGAIRRVDRDWFDFGYDEGTLRRCDAVVLDATLQLAPARPSLLRARVAANLARRRARHPPRAAERSAGCVFRNPPALSAARAIDAAGLKGRRAGSAVVSRRHANFVLNTGGATAADVLELIGDVRRRVASHSGIDLEPELAFLGVPAPGPLAGAAC